MRCSKPTGRPLASRSAPHVRASTPAPERAREPTKAQLGSLLAMRSAQSAAAQAGWLAAIGHDGGLFTWRSSPLIMLLGQLTAGGQ
jgi:hypothetical protein